jgi:hypothetical protein
MATKYNPVHGGYPDLNGGSKEQQFLDGLADLCNTYGFRIRGGHVDVVVNPTQPMSYAFNRMTGELLYSKTM